MESISRKCKLPKILQAKIDTVCRKDILKNFTYDINHYNEKYRYYFANPLDASEGIFLKMKEGWYYLGSLAEMKHVYNLNPEEIRCFTNQVQFNVNTLYHLVRIQTETKIQIWKKSFVDFFVQEYPQIRKVFLDVLVDCIDDNNLRARVKDIVSDIHSDLKSSQ